MFQVVDNVMVVTEVFDSDDRVDPDKLEEERLLKSTHR